MTNEEREKHLDWLYRLKSEIFVFMPKDWLIPFADALDVAIKALEQEPTTKNDLGVDAVSRDVVKEQMFIYGFHAPDMTVTEFVEDLPSVTPQEPRWISVSERLPNDNRKQLVYTKYGTYDIATYRKNKKEWMVSNEIDTYIGGVIAWMPLPKAYREVEE